MKETRERAECTVETESTRRERRSVRGFDCGGMLALASWGGGGRMGGMTHVFGIRVGEQI